MTARKSRTALVAQTMLYRQSWAEEQATGSRERARQELCGCLLFSPAPSPPRPRHLLRAARAVCLGEFQRAQEQAERDWGWGRMPSVACFYFFLLFASAPFSFSGQLPISVSSPRGRNGPHRGSHADISLADKGAPVSFQIKSYNAHSRIVTGSACL